MTNLKLIEIFYDEPNLEECYFLDENGSRQSVYENKTRIKERYCIDQDGLRQGLFEEFFEDGQLKISSLYENDILLK